MKQQPLKDTDYLNWSDRQMIVYATGTAHNGSNLSFSVLLSNHQYFVKHGINTIYEGFDLQEAIGAYNKLV
jgi:hypothetical protein